MTKDVDSPVRKIRTTRYSITKVFFIIVTAFIIGALFVVGMIGIVNPLVGSATHTDDSGVKACQTMAYNVKNSTKSKNVMTEESFQNAKKVWEDSQYPDLRVAGTNVMTTVYQMSQDESKDVSLGVTLVTLSTLQTQWGALQTACANHGVTIPALSRTS